MTFEVEPDPPVVGPVHLTISLTDAAGRPVEGADLMIEGAMAHACMQPRRAKARAASTGGYEAPFVWTMPGEWQLAVAATLPDGQEVARQFDLTVGNDLAAGDPHDMPAQIPNNGAVVRIVAPADGATFEANSEVKVQIETEQFALGQAGNHWHVYVDGQTPQMVMGQMAETSLRNLPPGRHQISVYLSVGTHQDLAIGDSVTIVVGEAGAEDINLNMESMDELAHEQD